MARLADGPSGASGQKRPEPARFAGAQDQSSRHRHRVALSADDASTEAMVLVSIVTEGEGKTNGKEERGWRAGNFEPARGEVHRGGWGSQEDNGSADTSYRRQEGAPRPDGVERGLDDAKYDRQKAGSKEHQAMRRRCLERVEAAAGLGFDELRRRHVHDVEALFDRVHFSLESSAEGSEVGLSASGSCVAGLPIRTRVSRSGKACTEEGEEGLDLTEGVAGSDGFDGTTVVDDGLIELMYHYGR